MLIECMIEKKIIPAHYDKLIFKKYFRCWL